VVNDDCIKYKVRLVCVQMDTNNDLTIVHQQYANSARSKQSCLTSSGTFIKTVFVQLEYNCVVFSCFACQTDCFCMQQVMAKEIVSFHLETQLK